jgi:hypothetical protein
MAIQKAISKYKPKNGRIVVDDLLQVLKKAGIKKVSDLP